MNLYPELIVQLRTQIEKENPSTVLDVWNAFKSFCSNLKLQDHAHVQSFGIQSECYLTSHDVVNQISKPTFEFILHYQIEYEIDGEEYCHMEHVICEFDLSDTAISSLTNDVRELWNYEYTFTEMFKIIESWEIFSLIQNEVIKVKVKGTEV